jgi:hypothetical protein
MIFLSSTMEDLQKERDATTEVVNTLRQVPIRAEYFVARRENPVEVCINEATKCSVYIGIFKEKYGFVPGTDNPYGLSVTALGMIIVVEARRTTIRNQAVN